jgi:oligoribonuclease NrnB/cAMP/cGMP phosphodiesterase (DHH superfamily)
MEKKYLKVKLFTHNDLDGIGSAILAIDMFGLDNVDVTYCKNPHDATEKVKEFWENINIDNYFDYDLIYITDISISDELAKHINETIDEKGFSTSLIEDKPYIKLLDHHKTALNLNQYKFCTVDIGDNINLNCGTSLFWNELYLKTYTNNIKQSFVELVRQYDTWLWKTHYNNNIPIQYNGLLYILGRDKFIESILNKFNEAQGNCLEHIPISLNQTEILLLDIENRNKNDYIANKNEELIIKQGQNVLKNYTYGVCFAEQFISELGNQLCELNPNIDFVVIIKSNSGMSFRTIKDDVDVSSIAQIYGGGGHPKASGASIGDNVRDKIIDLIL